ncbi:hypothetical protein [Flammeovirga sp. EKP202]|uniref:hypothetical protein n=1 Tax=Flammeovirga sp. EKP202 TaxID=2770592 RepID=UPI00165F196F|nr:hypothetical protein [Flammeovirga sp. EKP202]MBD0401589.1 hypothetical protein [Flammeovirga sp. EKP202]
MKTTTNAVLFLFIFFLSSSNLFAQCIDNNWDNFYLDASLVYTGVHYEGDQVTTSEPMEGWRFGSGMYINNGKHYSWEIGIGISKKRFENQFTDAQGVKSVRNTEIFSWDVPLIFHPQIPLGKYWAIAADIGMAYENRYKGTAITEGGGIKHYEDLRFVKKENDDPTSGFKKHDAYAILGGSIRFRNVKISAQHNFGIVDMDANKFERAYMQTTMFKLTGLF